ncbi:MAG: hypothetical protein ABIK28_15735 [Planctomycetota bacterium]
MKVQCPHCREIIEMERFSTSDEGLRFVCSDCHEQNFLQNPCRVACKAVAEVHGSDLRKTETPKPSPEPSSAPAKRFKEFEGGEDEVVCPKCGHAQTDHEACHCCGLSFTLFDPGKLPPDPREAARLWESVLEQPDDLGLHDRFVEACNKADRLDYAHRKYRIFERETGRIDLVETMRYRIQELAQVHLSAFNLSPSASTHESSRQRKTLWIIVAIMGLIWIAYVVMDSLAVFKS